MPRNITNKTFPCQFFFKHASHLHNTPFHKILCLQHGVLMLHSIYHKPLSMSNILYFHTLGINTHSHLFSQQRLPMSLASINISVILHFLSVGLF